MKIALLLSTLDDGGAAAIVSQLTTHLSEEFKVDIILNNSEKICFPYSGEIIDLGIKKIPLDKSSIRYQLRVFVRRLFTLGKLKRRNNYDACISYLDSANVVNILTKLSARKCRVVINVVNNMSNSAKADKKYKYIVNPLIRLFYNMSDGIIAQTQDIKSDLVSNYRISENKIFVNYSAVDIQKIDSIISTVHEEQINKDFAEKWIDKDKTIITAGRFVPQKGHGHLIRAFHRVVDIIPDAKLVLFGTGELKEYYLDLIQGYHLENNVSLHEFDPMYVWYIAHSAIFCFPSIHEGLGMALQDAMACNTACVAADYKTGARELLASNYDGKIDYVYYANNGIITREMTGQLYCCDDPLDKSELALADAMVELLNDEARRNMLGNKAREMALQYDISKITKQWEDIIKSISTEYHR